MENLDKIVEEGQKLAEKRTWLEKGFADLMEKINWELGKIPDMGDEDDISYFIRGYNYYPNPHEKLERKIYARMVFGGSTCIEVYLKKETYCEKWEEVVIEHPTVLTIREFSRQLPGMFSQFLREVERRNTDSQAAIDIITSLSKAIRCVT